MSSPNDSSAPTSPGVASYPVQVSLLAIWVALWMGLQALMARWGLGAGPQAGILLLGLLLVLGGLSLGWRERFLGLLTAVTFAISQILFMGMVIALGTLVSQELPGGPPPKVFGHELGRWAQALGVGDVFHSLGFLALLALLSLSMLAVAWKRRPYSLPRAGFLLVHMAPTFLLVGSLLGQFAGVKAWAELKVGQGAYRFQRLQGAESGRSYVLPGFRVRLDRLEVRRRASDTRLLMVRQQLNAGLSSANPEALPLEEGCQGKLPGTGLEYEVERWIPRAMELGKEQPSPAEARDPDVLVVLLGVGSPEPLIGVLHAFGDLESRKDEPLGRFAVVFREQLDPEFLASLRPHPARSESLLAMFGGRRLEVPARVGARLDVGAATLTVRAVYPDFQVRRDGEGNPVMRSRSLEPRDPWLEVDMAQPGKARQRVLLSAHQPEYSDQLNAANLPQGLSLRYLREGEETMRRFVVFSRVERRVALVDAGAVVREGSWELNHPFVIQPGLSVTPLGLFDRFNPVPVNSPETSGVPALRIKVVDPVQALAQRAWLPPDGQAHAFFGGRVALSLGRIADPRDVQSTLVITDPQGRELARQEVGVNKPLVYDGLAFLQSPHPSGDPQTCIILVVDQPGAWIAWVGYGLLLLGVVWMFYLKPWFKRRTAAEGR